MKDRLTPAKVKRALRESRGLLYLAARTLGCNVRTLYNYRQKYPDVDQVCEDARGELIDVAEDKLVAAINTGEPWAIQFFLRMQAKHRGYVERQEVTGSHGGPIEIDDAAERERAAAIRELLIALRAALDGYRSRAGGEISLPVNGTE